MMRPTLDGAGIVIELPAPPSTDRIKWLRGELLKVLEALHDVPFQRPAKKAEGNPAYAAGLVDMAQWILDKVDHDIEWQSFRQFLSPSFDLPVDSSSIGPVMSARGGKKRQASAAGVKNKKH